jgi:hypothetical protein
MSEPRSFAVKCPEFGVVELTTDKWKVEQDGANRIINYSGDCKCGEKHFGSTLPAVEVKIHRAVAAQLGLDLQSRAKATEDEFVTLTSYPRANGVSDFVIVNTADEV